MQTLIKWPGGKSREFEYIKDLMPQYERYMEPFFGGGAVFFQLKSNKAIINDTCEELVDFYKFIKKQEDKEEFRKALYDYWRNNGLKKWKRLPLVYVSSFIPKTIIDNHKKFKKWFKYYLMKQRMQ